MITDKIDLKPGHPIHTLMSEYEIISEFLDKLEKINNSVQKIKNYDTQNQKFSQLTDIAEHLIKAEPHHQREEKVLFPELEERGVFGPPEVMR